MVNAPDTMKHPEKLLVPPFVARAMFALMIGAVALVSYAQIMDVPQIGVVDPTPIVASVDVVITGDKTGIYQVHSLDGTLLAQSSDDKAGFLGVLGRMIARDRVTKGVTGTPPLQVVHRADGTIAILDASTGGATELLGYGSDNVAAFANLID